MELNLPGVTTMNHQPPASEAADGEMLPEYDFSGQTGIRGKCFYVEADGVRRQPANPEMAPLYLRQDEIEILEIVSRVVRMTT